MEIPVKEKIKQWCQEVQLFKEEIVDERTSFHFRVLAPNKGSLDVTSFDFSTIDIIQPAGENDVVIVQAGISFDEDFMAYMKTLQESEQLIFDLHMTLESRPESYLLDHTDNVIKTLVVFEEIFFDGLTKDRLITAIKGVNKSLILALWILRPTLEVLSGVSDSGSLIDSDDNDVDISADDTVDIAVTAKESAGFCPECGKENKKKAKFCTKCGASLEEEN